MSQRWQAVSNTVSNFLARDLNLKPPAPETIALLLRLKLINTINLNPLKNTC